MIAGRYADLAEIGQGGMGTVYRAIDSQTSQVVAIKQLKNEMATPDMIERFKREGEALRQLNHPNIVKFLDAFVEDEQYYLVLEYVVGGSLEDHIRNNAPINVNKSLLIALELADALTRSHHLGILHRDIKPANVLLAEDNTPRLTDFGLAYRHQSDVSLTGEQEIMGTLPYMSPEALHGAQLDERADIWAFGVVLFEMLSGIRPFVGETATALMQQILLQPPPPRFRDPTARYSDCAG